MVLGVLVFFRYKPMSKDELSKAGEGWEKFKKKLPRGVSIVAEYDHAFGTDWNGFFLVEAKSMDAFQRFWGKFRDETRWYVERVQSVIGVKRG